MCAENGGDKINEAMHSRRNKRRLTGWHTFLPGRFSKHKNVEKGMKSSVEEVGVGVYR